MDTPSSKPDEPRPSVVTMELNSEPFNCTITLRFDRQVSEEQVAWVLGGALRVWADAHQLLDQQAQAEGGDQPGQPGGVEFKH